MTTARSPHVQTAFQLLKPSFVPLIAAFLLFGSPDAPGTKSVPTVGGEAHAYTCSAEFTNMQDAWNHYMHYRTTRAYRYYLAAAMDFYSCAMTSEG